MSTECIVKIYTYIQMYLKFRPLLWENAWSSRISDQCWSMQPKLFQMNEVIRIPESWLQLLKILYPLRCQRLPGHFVRVHEKKIPKNHSELIFTSNIEALNKYRHIFFICGILSRFAAFQKKDRLRR